MTEVRAAEMQSPDDEPMYVLEIAGATLDALDKPGAPLDDPEADVVRSYVLSREALHRLVAELHKAEGVA
ncbi:hypothetical protein [Blastococcus sp. CT_GayMR16]|uniref:hypothetical protein n=1 Tax=Blastococcus sp. CT_GayMR16 TaxID=2559607 RepID=UPI00107388E8|nr:hypothetical protein [Blastococcus sp. CT_GayMR16]